MGNRFANMQSGFLRVFELELYNYIRTCYPVELDKDELVTALKKSVKDLQQGVDMHTCLIVARD